MPESLVLGVSAAALGAILGSFLNALSFRFNTGRGMGGRSRCMRCGHTLEVLDLIPVLSFILLRGRCRYCGARISAQYPLVEATAALIALLSFLAHPEPLQFLFWLLVFMVLLFVAVYDIRHTIIPLSCTLLMLLLAALHLVATGAIGEPLALAAGPILALPLLLLSLVSRGRWMGWADGALELSIGSLLGLTMGLTALVLAFWSGAVVGIALLLWGRALPVHRQVTMKSEVPFAPFLALGALVAHFFNVDFFSELLYVLPQLFS